jgi:hypothetical protein
LVGSRFSIIVFSGTPTAKLLARQRSPHNHDETAPNRPTVVLLAPAILIAPLRIFWFRVRRSSRRTHDFGSIHPALQNRIVGEGESHRAIFLSPRRTEARAPRVSFHVIPIPAITSL